MQAAVFAVNTGVARLQAGDVDGAIESFESAVTLDAGNAQAHYQLAKALLAKGRPDAAKAEYDTARQLDPRVKPLLFPGEKQ
jgi:Flp pilus assembly protein TadD